MTRQKGISTLLRAARFVHQSRPDVRFLLVGPRESEGPLAISQEEIEQHAPYVVATGARSDVPSLLKLSDMFAFPTEYREGVPRALLEASLAGLPIVTTNMPGCQEVVRDSWNGFVVPTHAPDQLARRILDVLNNPEGARRMAALGNETVRNKFGLRSIVRSHIELYDRLIQNPGRSVEPATAWG